MLNVRGRRQVAGETRRSFPATLADTGSKYVLDTYRKIMHTQICQAEVRPTTPLRSLLETLRHQVLRLSYNFYFFYA